MSHESRALAAQSARPRGVCPDLVEASRDCEDESPASNPHSETLTPIGLTHAARSVQPLRTFLPAAELNRDNLARPSHRLHRIPSPRGREAVSRPQSLRRIFQAHPALEIIAIRLRVQLMNLAPQLFGRRVGSSFEPHYI